MGTLFESGSEDEDFNRLKVGQSEYAKKYDTLRRKEELLKLKNKYGEKPQNSSESSSSEDDDDVSFTEEFEKDFFKTLSCLKNKDPKIYDKEVRFFNKDSVDIVKKPKDKKEKALTIRDYNREQILNEETFEDEDDRPRSPTYVEEQRGLKTMFKKVLSDNEDDEEGIGGMFSRKTKTKTEEEEEEKSYREWLAGQSDRIDDTAVESELKPLKDYWNNPKLDENEAFLRDYVLNQRFKEDSDRIPTYDEIVNPLEDDLSEDEKMVGKQAEFEHKFNFRFEEPDTEFIKRYPRTLEHTLRQKDDKRAKKRAETKERKQEEKKRKREEISQLKALKLKEIQEKIVKLKEITGNEQLAFDEEDIEGDFDPAAHDRRMQQLFNDEYYNEDGDAEKPEFPDLDEELEIENWEKYGEGTGTSEPHCEDEDFNMDCDYDPNDKKKSTLEDLKETIEGKSKRKRRRKNKLSQALEKEKPQFDPEKLGMTLSQYLDEYYNLDCEDVIGDLPCRYRYREVPACTYGLTMEEILLADDKELNKWYPLKRMLQYKSDHVDLNDQKNFARKGNDINLKKKILPSLFKPEVEDETVNGENSNEGVSPKKKKKKNKRKNKESVLSEVEEVVNESNAEISIENDSVDVDEPKKKKKRKTAEIQVDVNEGEKPKKKKKKPVDDVIEENNISIEDEKLNKKKKKRETVDQETVIENGNSKKKKRKRPDVESCDLPAKKSKKDSVNKSKNNSFDGGKGRTKKNKQRDRSHAKPVDPLQKLTDERLQAYGLNPKKYRNFMKFKTH